MRVSLNIVKKYIDFNLPPVDVLTAKINAQLGGVEEVINLGEKYKDAKIVRVVESLKHPNADKLSVCKIDAGTGELVQVVCGASNVHADMWAVWLPPASTVPATFGDKEPFVLGSRELRGEVSNGMLASARELAIGEDHDGIVDIARSDVPEGKELKEGSSFAEIFELDDYVVTIENKMFTHRPDLFGQLGVAREIAGIFGEQFRSPDWYTNLPEFSHGSGKLQLKVFNDIPEKAPRFMAVAIRGTEIRQSPLWLRCALVSMGGKPINNIVDVTNYIMLLTAQPVHAYDYNKIRGGRLGIRMANAGEKLRLLNGKTYDLSDEDIVIADGEGVIGLAGIMGGGDSEISGDTKSIILEVASFDMYSVRKSSMRHGLFTDAVTRFNKGQSPLQNPVVLAKLMGNIDGEQATEVFDMQSEVIGKMEGSARSVYGQNTIMVGFINERLGLSLNGEDVARLLKSVEIECYSVNDGEIGYHAPFWRTDLELPEDIVEEVGRLYGYDRLPLELPTRASKPTTVNAQRELSHTLRQILMRAGANEVLTYSFVHERVLSAATQSKDDAYRLSNALSPDLQYYRLSLTPSLLDRVHANIKAGYDEFALFEIGKSHSKIGGFDEDGLPLESARIALAYANKHVKEGPSFYIAKTFLEFIAKQTGIEFRYEQLGGAPPSPMAAPFEPKRSAVVSDKRSGLSIGVVGEFRKTVATSLKLPEYSSGFEIDTHRLLDVCAKVASNYRALSRFPSVYRDISLRVDRELTYEKVHSAVSSAVQSSALSALYVYVNIKPVAIYQPEGSDKKNVTFRVTFTPYEKTLTNDEVHKIIDKAAHALESSLGSEIL